MATVVSLPTSTGDCPLETISNPTGSQVISSINNNLVNTGCLPAHPDKGSRLSTAQTPGPIVFPLSAHVYATICSSSGCIKVVHGLSSSPTVTVAMGGDERQILSQVTMSPLLFVRVVMKVLILSQVPMSPLLSALFPLLM